MSHHQFNYLTGFGNEHQTEALPGALPQGQFSPQRCPYDLYAEQLSSTAFTAPRSANRRTWTYRIRPSVAQAANYRPLSLPLLETAPIATSTPPDPMRWDPLPMPTKATSFIEGLVTIAVNGSAESQHGLAIHYYRANRSMNSQLFNCADGELLLVPQLGELQLDTELGQLSLAAGEIAVIPRGIKFRVQLLGAEARGYLCENYGAALELPERGPVGANGYANDRDFLYPTAWFEDVESEHQLITKFCGLCYHSKLSYSPFDVVAWTGNSAPYKYDLARFNVINTVSFDHPDPSIFTVLTSPSETNGWANLDFVIFPPRWMVAENSFRPPWYHRNVMSEFMGLIEGSYDAKQHGFSPGGMSLHNCMTPHGPEAEVFAKASTMDLAPQRYQDTMAFMFESRYVIKPTTTALHATERQLNYANCWQNIEKLFKDSQ
ncbi:homogentisate 1,2-dioxygenase [Ferrimonas lipolytica]|uniref:Homogentisate 1,2-dioxygenase n=1 Tax=Ferrimonas lipolytica TaxID=2724191 RepID=A0A6H1UDJ9_9GAMM|nr:homogentisate 1,2-dioxygenase [Ferrimonas lipolytica]QIZ76699.1 homogentisate 1,2-dioxygenase [Ferrimonas lipolytica]